MEPRLQSSIMVSALIRRAQAEGGNGAVLAKGDASAGAILVILAERGRNVRILERLLQPNGSYSWQETGNQALANPQEEQKFLAQRRRFDSDLWILELDVPSAERFAAEMNEWV
jgi:hypothetical protein